MTSTDSKFTDRINGFLKDNFLTNIDGTFSANANLVEPLINRIGKTIIENPDVVVSQFSEFDRPAVPLGDTIQKIKTKYIKGEAFENTIAYTPDPYAKNVHNPIAQYVEFNDAMEYRDTITDDILQKAFASQDNLDGFIQNEISGMAYSMNIDKDIKWKKYLSRKDYLATTGTTENPTNLNTLKTVTMGVDLGKDYHDAIRDFIDGFSYASTLYNKEGDMAKSTSVDVIIRKQDWNAIKDYYSQVYNVSAIDIENQANFIKIDDFATPTDGSTIGAIVCDSRAFDYYPRSVNTSSIRNPRGLYTNYSAIVQGTYCINNYRNIAMIQLEDEA